MAEERRSSERDAEFSERVLLLDAELESSAPAIRIDDEVALAVKRGRATRLTQGGAPSSSRKKRGSRGEPPAEEVALSDPETDASAAGTDNPSATKERASRAPRGNAPANAKRRSRARSTQQPVQMAGVELGNVATEILDPFVRAIEVLLRGLADSVGEEIGGPATVQFGSTVIQYSSPGWGDDVVRVYRTQPYPDAAVAGPVDGRSPLEGVRHPRDRWELGASAAREGDHAVALQLFEEEAKEAENHHISQRAAIAYRSASREAGLIGRRDYANMLLRLAGKHYLHVAEDVHTSARGKVQAFVTAAKCFLQAGNLPLAESCIARARSGGEALGEGPGDLE